MRNLSNLPPGVSVGMIPGNRPEDEWWEKFCDKLEIPEELSHYTDPEYIAIVCNQLMMAINSIWRELGFYKEADRYENQSDHYECGPHDVDESGGVRDA